MYTSTLFTHTRGSRRHETRTVPAKAHLREALVLHEESQRLQRMCRDLKAKQALAKVLKRVQESTVEDYNGIGDEDDFRGLLDPPDIIGIQWRKWQDHLITNDTVRDKTPCIVFSLMQRPQSFN